MQEINFKQRCFNKFHWNVLKQIAKALEAKIPDDCDYHPNKKHNIVLLVGGTKYFVVYEFIEEEQTLVGEVKQVK